MRYVLMVAVISMFWCVFTGCSSISVQPNTPDLSQDEFGQTSSGVLYDGSFEIDLETMSITQIENRQPEFIYDITGFLPDKCPGGCFRFTIVGVVGTVLEIELTLENPLAIQAFDLRIEYIELFGKTVINPDSYTDFLGIPISGIHPFTAFSKELPNRAFPLGPGGIDTETLFLDFPPGSPSSVNYAITASLPDNVGEPYEISEMAQEGELNPSGGTAIISCRVDDHQDDVSYVFLNATPFTGAPVQLLPSGGGIYEAEISNTESAPVGAYNQLIMALSSNPQNISTYNYVEITVGEFQPRYWTQFQNNLHHNGQTNVTGPQTNHVEWTYESSGMQALLVLEGYDGTLYCGSSADGGLVAVNPDGTEKWTYSSSVSIRYVNPMGVTPEDDVLYVSVDPDSGVEYIAGLDTANGTELWTFNLRCTNANYGLVLENGDLAASGPTDPYGYNCFTKRIDKYGDEVWACSSSVTFTSGPTQGVNGDIYARSNDAIIAIDPDTGSIVNTYDVDGYNIQTITAVRSDGTVVFGANAGSNSKIICLDAELNEVWFVPISESVPIRGLGVGLNDEVYITFNSTLYAIAADGSQVDWSWYGASSISSPAIDSEGTIYTGTNDGVAAFYPDGNLKWRRRTSGIGCAPIIAHDGSLYVNVSSVLVKIADEE
jgi:hypothetical protein